jgi:large subunit ribosomal protein L21
MYAIVKTGGKQYRVERGQTLLVERLRADDGATVALDPLLYVDGSEVVDGGDLSKVNVSARVVAHERGPKLRVVKFKPKRGYKRRTGHRQELTRIEVTEIKLGSGRSRTAKTPAQAESTKSEAAKPAAGKAPATKTPAKPTTRKAPATKSDAETTPEEKNDGA